MIDLPEDLLAEALKEVRASLNQIRPTYVVDSLKRDDEGNPVPPKEDEHIVIDLADAIPEPDFDGGFTNVMVFVASWAPFITTAFQIQGAVRTKLEAEGWEFKGAEAAGTLGMRSCEARYLLTAAY